MSEELAEPSRTALAEEIKNFQDIATFLKPSSGEVPEVDGVDIHGVSMPLDGIIGGDHILYIDYRKRYNLDERIAQAEAAGHAALVSQLRLNKGRAGVLVADVAGHRITDALLVAMLHQAFLLGSYYEMDMFGTITTKIFENINARFHESTTINKYLTALYGEISGEGSFRYISAGHPAPVVFSHEFNRIMTIGGDRRISCPPIGVLRSGDDPDAPPNASRSRSKKLYTINEIRLLGRGDILILHTDGLSEHGRGEFFPMRLERCLREAKHLGAREIAARVRASLLALAIPDDDITFVIIKNV